MGFVPQPIHRVTQPFFITQAQRFIFNDIDKRELQKINYPISRPSKRLFLPLLPAPCPLPPAPCSLPPALKAMGYFYYLEVPKGVVSPTKLVNPERRGVDKLDL